MSEMTPRSTVPGVLLTIACLVIVVAGLKVAAPLLILLALASFLVVATRPAVTGLVERRVPMPLAVTLVVLLTFGILALFVSVATQSLAEIRGSFQGYAVRYQTLEDGFLFWLRGHGIDVPPAFQLDIVNARRALDFATGAVRGVAGFASGAVLVLVIAIFGMVEADRFRTKLAAAFGTGAADHQRFAKIINEVQRYLTIKTVISLITGFLIGLWCWAIGLDFAIFWGLVAFILNYIPSIGSFIAAVPAFMLALIQLGPSFALLSAIGYIAVNILLGNVIEPMLLGRQLGLSPLVVIVSVVFWGWLWGPIGFLLAVPLTMIARIMLENTEGYSWIAVLMAPVPEQRKRRRKPLSGDAKLNAEA
jgi:predicted PurR-regulated permease PerM